MMMSETRPRWLAGILILLPGVLIAGRTPIATAQEIPQASATGEPAAEPDTSAGGDQAGAIEQPESEAVGTEGPVIGPATTPPSAVVRRSFDSPQATMFTFLDAFARDDRATTVACLDLSLVEADRGWDIAAKLVGILNVWGKVNRWDLPGAGSVRMNELQEFEFYPGEGWAREGDPFENRFPQGRILLAADPETGEWRFSAETVAQIRDFWAVVEDMERRYGQDVRERNFTLWLRSRIPDSLKQNSVLTLQYWQWIGLAIVILVGVTLDFTVRFFLHSIAVRLIRRRGGEASPKTLRRTVRPFGLIAAAWFWMWAISPLDMPDQAYTVLTIAVKFFTMVAAVWAGYRLTDLGTEVLASKAARTTTKFDDLLVPLVRTTIKVLITVFGFIYIVDALGKRDDIVPLLTGLGIGGLAVAFAAKDTIENFFGSIAVIIDRPFEVGDWIAIGDLDGTVEEVGFRSTRVRTFYNSLVTVPNATLVRAQVDNYGRRKYRRFSTHLGITYDTPPDLIEAFCEGIREIVRVHPYTRKDYYHVYLNKFGPASLDILLYIFHEAPEWSTELRERHRLMLDIIRLADRLGIEFAFPTQTIHLRQEAEGRARAPADPPGRKAELAAQRLGRKAVHHITREAPWRGKMPEPVVIDRCSIGEDDDDADADADDETQIETRTGGEEGG